MLLHDYAFVPVPAEWVCARIIADRGEWLSGLAAGAAREGETWRATGSQGIFPVLSADLEVAALSPQITHLTLRGSYEPPLGAVGQRLDRLLMHRVAEATIRSFMRRLAESLADTVANEGA